MNTNSVAVQAARPSAEPDVPPQPQGFCGDFIVLGTSPWKLVHSLGEHTVNGLLARGNRVLVVEPLLALYSLIKEKARWQKPSANARAGLRQLGQNLWVLTPTPVALPGASRSVWPTRINGWILSKLLKRVSRQIGFSDPIIYTLLYNSASAVRRFPAKLKVYDCGEEESALAQSERHRRMVRRMDGELCRTVDLVLTVTEELAERRRAFNPNTHEVNCAADPEFFGTSLRQDLPVPEDIASLPKPVLGYLGGMDPWKIDVGLLTHLARARPQYSIVMVGYVWFGFDPAPLKACPNIHVLGPRPYELFPSYLKGMDVCLMPFPLNDITRNGDALKCYEYLSGGKPVVSTPVPVARRMSEFVRIATTPDEFVAQVDAAVADHSAELVRRRVDAICSAHTWSHRVDQKLTLIQQALEKMKRRTAATS